MGVIVAILVGIMGGIASAIQAPFTGIMGQKLGSAGSVFFTYSIGGVVILLFILLSRTSLSGWQELPWYVYLAGPLGLVIIFSLSFTVPRLGAVTGSALFILAWLFSSAIIDQFGWLGVQVRTIDISRILGVAALILGTWLVSK